MKRGPPVPIHTLEEALALAKDLLAELSRADSQARRGYRIFASLAASDPVGLAAYLIWRARGEVIRKWAGERHVQSPEDETPGA